MATADARRHLREQPLGVTVLLTIVGYALVLGTFLLDVPIYPDLTNAQVNLLSHVIAVINTTATVVLTLGWYWIRAGEVEKHRLAMVSGFVLILGFLVVYLLKVGGGGTKEFVGPKEAGLKEIYVDPEVWGQGVGTALLERGLEVLPEHVEAVTLEMLAGNDVGAGFYEARGFEKTGASEAEIGDATYRTVIYSLEL